MRVWMLVILVGLLVVPASAFSVHIVAKGASINYEATTTLPHGNARQVINGENVNMDLKYVVTTDLPKLDLSLSGSEVSFANVMEYDDFGLGSITQGVNVQMTYVVDDSKFVHNVTMDEGRFADTMNAGPIFYYVLGVDGSNASVSHVMDEYADVVNVTLGEGHLINNVQFLSVGYAYIVDEAKDLNYNATSRITDNGFTHSSNLTCDLNGDAYIGFATYNGTGSVNVTCVGNFSITPNYFNGTLAGMTMDINGVGSLIENATWMSEFPPAVAVVTQ